MIGRVTDALRRANAKAVTALAIVAASAVAVAMPQPAYAFETATLPASYTNNGMTIDSVRLDGIYNAAYEGNSSLTIQYTAGGKTYNSGATTLMDGNCRLQYTVKGHIDDYRNFKSAALKAVPTGDSLNTISALYGPIVTQDAYGCVLHTENSGNLLAIENGNDTPTQKSCSFEMQVIVNLSSGYDANNAMSGVTGIELAGTTWKFKAATHANDHGEKATNDEMNSPYWDYWGTFDGVVYDAYTNGRFSLGNQIITAGLANYVLRHKALPSGSAYKELTDNINADCYFYAKLTTTAMLPDGTWQHDGFIDPNTDSASYGMVQSVAYKAYSDTEVGSQLIDSDKYRDISTFTKLSVGQMSDAATAKANTPIGSISYAMGDDGTMYVCAHMGPFFNNPVYGGSNYDQGIAMDSASQAQLQLGRDLGMIGLRDVRQVLYLRTQHPDYVHKVDFTMTYDGFGPKNGTGTSSDAWYGDHVFSDSVTTKQLNGNTSTYVILKYDKNLDAATGSMDPTYSTPGMVQMSQNAFYAKGYDFLGWADTPDGPVAYADGAQVNVPSGVKTVYAKWRYRKYSLSVDTTASAPSGMTTKSSDAVHDTISTTVLDSNGGTASDALKKIAGYDSVAVDVTLHHGGYGTRAATQVTKTTTATPGSTFDSPSFSPSDFKFTNSAGQEEAWNTWGKGDYWFTVSIAQQGNMLSNVSLDQKEDAESFTVQSSGAIPEKKLYDETDKRTVNEQTESLVYNMTYYAQITAMPEGSADLWIRDIIDATDVTVDNANAYVTKADTGERVPADIQTTQSNGQTITIAHIASIVQPKSAYTLHVPQRPRARKTSWVIGDTPGWSVTNPTDFSDYGSHKLPVIPPENPNKVWVLNEDGALTASDPNGTNAISDIENGHADTKTFLLGDTIGAVVNGKIRKNLVDPLRSYSITDDVSGSSKYIAWDVSKTKVFIDGKDYTAQFDVKWDGSDKIVATAKSDFLKSQTGIVNSFGTADHAVKLYISGTITAVGDKGETVKLVNDATMSVNGQEVQSNEPASYVWQPNPDKTWAKCSEDDGKINATVSDGANPTDSGDDQTFLDGSELGSVVNGQVPANLAEVPSKLVLYDDWTASDYIVDPQDVSTVRVYETDVTDTSKSTVQDIARTGTDVTKYFTIAYNSTDLTKATKCTATAKQEYIDKLLNLDKGKQITLVIPMRANYAGGAGVAQVRKDYGVNDGDEVVMTNAPDGTPFTNVAGEIIGGSDVKTNAPKIHGYVPPVKKDVLATADESGDQRSIDGGKAEPGDKVEYVLTTEPKFPSSLAYSITSVTIRDAYDELLTIDKQTVEVHDLSAGRVVPRSKYKIAWDDASHEFKIDITDADLLASWKAGGAPRLQTRFEATIATEDKIPDSRKETDGYVVVNNQWFLSINHQPEDESNLTTLYIPPITPEKEDKQATDTSIDIDGKTLFLGDAGEYRITLDASEYAAPSESDKTTDAYNVYRLGIVDDYDDEYLSADAKNVTVLDEQGKDVTGKFNVQIKDGVLYVFAKLVDTVVPSTQETVKATQPDDLKAYAENDKHNPETEPAIDQSLLGQKYTVVLPYVVSKVEDGYVVSNQAFQTVDDRSSKLTNIVTNPVKPLDPKKDVTITADGDNVGDGSEIALNSFFNYKLSSTAIPTNRAYKTVSKWGITDNLDEKYDKFTGQWVVIARNDVYGKDGNVLFKAGDVIAESKAYHAAKAKADALSTSDTDGDAESADTDDSKSADDDAQSDADADDAATGTAADASDADADTSDADADAAADDSDSDTSDTADDDRILSDSTSIDEKTEAYGDTPYFTAMYENGTYSLDATDAFLDLVSEDEDHEYAWDTYIQCERTWVTDRHENVFTETFNNAKTDSNIVWTYTPEHPSISVTKYEASLGVDAGSAASSDVVLTVSGDTEIAFLVTNTGDVPLVDVSVSDETIDGTGTVNGITFPDGWDGTLDPGESVTAVGTLTGVEPGTSHTDRGTATGKSYYTGTETSASDEWHGKADPQPIMQTGDATSNAIGAIASVSGVVALCAFVACHGRRRAA